MEQGECFICYELNPQKSLKLQSLWKCKCNGCICGECYKKINKCPSCRKVDPTLELINVMYFLDDNNQPIPVSQESKIKIGEMRHGIRIIIEHEYIKKKRSCIIQ
jgi:hypothetical protein